MAALHLTEGNYDKDFPTAVDEFPTVEDLQHYIDAWELNSLFSSIKVVQQYLITHKDAIESTVLDSFSGADGVKEIPVPAGRYPAGKTCTAGDADLVAANIKKDTIIFGVTGSLDVTAKDSFSGAEGLKVIPIPAGTYPAEKTCTAVDADLVAANIKDGVTIFGVEGSLEGAPSREMKFYPHEDDEDGYCTSGGTFDNNDSYIGCGAVGTTSYHGWFVFPSVDIINGSTIKSCVMTFTAWNAKAGTHTSLKLHFNEEDDGVRPNNITTFNALALDDGVEWNDLPAWVSDVEYASPDLKTLLQNIVDREGWASGNQLVIVVKDNGSDAGDYKLISSVHDVYGAYKASLHVTWTEPAA